MKRIIALLLVLIMVMSMCACKKKKADATDPSTEPTQTQATQPATQATKPKNLPYKHPLTGEGLETPYNGQLVAVMVNNLKKAMPQHGISQADILYEIEVEGDITRCLAVFSDLSDVKTIGPIRSARTVFNSVAVSYDAPLVHAGGSQGLALSGRYGSSYDTIENWEHIDQSYNGDYFFRDSARYNSGYAWEHTLFTTGEKLTQAMEKKGYNTPTDKTYGLQFAENVDLKGEKAERITIQFKSGKKTVLTYDAATKQYGLNMHGTEHIDGNTGKPVTFKNVIAIYANQYYADSVGHKFYDSIGSGEGYAAINGTIVPITWKRDGLRNQYTYALKDGTPLTLDVGTSFIALVGIKNPIAYE